MGGEAILVMWPRCREQTYILPTHQSSVLYLALIGQVVSEKKAFEERGRRMTEDDRRTEDGARLHYKLTYEPKGSVERKCCYSKEKRQPKKLEIWHC